MKRHHAKTWIALLLALQLLFTSGWTAFAWPLFYDSIYVSDMTPKSVEVGSDRLYTNQFKGEKLSIRTYFNSFTNSDKGILANTPSAVVYDIEGLAANRFTALCGIWHSAPNNTSCQFTVKIDGVQSLTTPTVTPQGDGYRVDVVIPEGAKTLTLISTQGGEGNGESYPAVWLNPSLHLPDANVVTSISLLSGHSVLPVGSSDIFKVVGFQLNGTTSILSSNMTFQTDNPAVASVDAQGKVTALMPGKATITASYPVNDVLHTATCPVVVHQTDAYWRVDSPNEGTSVVLGLDGDGTLYHQVTRESKAIVVPSALGIKTSLGDFSSGLTFQGVTSKRVEESYTLPSGKYSTYTDSCQEEIFTFTKGEALLQLHLRVYDQGYAFRYIVGKQDGSSGTMTISEETSTFALPGGSNLFGMEPPGEDTEFNYEENYIEKKIESAERAQSMPLLYQSPEGLWTLISEANLYGDPYCGSFLQPIGGNTLQTVWDPTQTGDVQTVYPFTSPWRFAVSGSPGDIVESAMTENLNEPNTDDVSWVKPGAAAWTGLTGGFSMQRDKKTILEYIEFASDMGWKYFILDEGWQPDNPSGGTPRYLGYYEWFDEVLAYADSKEVGLVVWVRATDLDTPAKREILKEFAKRGIAGVKVESFGGESQRSIQLYKDIYETCYQNKLVVSVHGANKPTGENRTYPNLLNREAVRGEKYGIPANDQAAIWPFVRGVVGSMDVSPRMHVDSAITSVNRQLAMSILYESGMPTMASSIDEYDSVPGLSLLKNLPAAWDDIHYMGGVPGQYTAIARRSGDIWYVSVVANTKQWLRLPLDFLEQGVYYRAVIYYNDMMSGRVSMDFESVNQERIFETSVPEGGGYCIKLVPAGSPEIESISLPENITVTVGESVKLTPLITPKFPAIPDIRWSTSDLQIATVANDIDTGASVNGGKITGKKVGQAVITVTAVNRPSVTAQCVVNVVNPNYILEEGWTLCNPSIKVNQPQIHPDNPYRTTLKTLKGDVDTWRNAENMLMREAPKGDFTMTLKVSGGFSKDQQGVGLSLYVEESSVFPAFSVFSMMRRFHSGLGGNCFELYHWMVGDRTYELTAPDSQKDTNAYLKLERKGNTFTGSYSYDNVNWTPISETITKEGLSTFPWNLKVGVYALSGQFSDAVTDVTVEDFTVNGETIPFYQYDDGRTIVAAAPLEEFTVPNGTSFEELELPDQTEVYLTGGQTLQLPVIWQKGNYDGGIDGSYTLTGVITESDQAVNPRGVTVSATVRVGQGLNVEILSDVIVKDRPFQVRLTSNILPYGKLTLFNEQGRKVSYTMVMGRDHYMGWETVLSLSLGTARENAVINVYQGDLYLGAFRLTVLQKEPTAVHAVTAPDSAEVNQTFRVEVRSTSDLTKGKFFSESGKVIGSNRVSRVVTGDVMVTTYELKIGTAGERTITFRGAYDKSEDWGFDWDFDIHITPKQ